MTTYNVNDRMPSSGRILAEDSEYINVADVINSILGDGAINISGADNPTVDAFQRIRISSPTAIFDNTFQYDENPLIWVQKTTNGGSLVHSPSNSSVLFSVPDLNDTIIYQTKSYIRYQPGRSQLLMITYGQPPARNLFRCGYYDGENGIFFQLNNGLASFSIRSNVSGTPVDNNISQSEWNIDTLDGTGKSGITLDQTKAQIIVIDLEWLSLGRVRVGFNIDGSTIYVHQFVHANILTMPYMQTANLPVRYELVNTTGDSSNVLAICSVVFSEGGDSEERGLGLSAANTTPRGFGTAFQPVVSIRPKATYGGVTNRAGLFPDSVNSLAINNIIEVAAFYNASLTNASWISANDNSLMEYDQSAQTIVGGIKLLSFFVAAGGQGSGAYASAGQNGLLGKYPLGRDVDGNNPDTLTIAARAITSPASALCSIQWREVR